MKEKDIVLAMMCKNIIVFLAPSLLRGIWPFKPYCTR